MEGFVLFKTTNRKKMISTSSFLNLKRNIFPWEDRYLHDKSVTKY